MNRSHWIPLTGIVLGISLSAGLAQAQDKRCCNVPKGAWVISPPVMSAERCLARPNHSPEGTPPAVACTRGSRQPPTPPPPQPPHKPHGRY